MTSRGRRRDVLGGALRPCPPRLPCRGAEHPGGAHDPMIPYTLVLEPGLVIHKIYMGYWFFGRPTLEDLRQDLRAVLKKCRPDWDISTPELKAAWREGRKELFYPYGKSYAQTIGEQD